MAHFALEYRQFAVRRIDLSATGNSERGRCTFDLRLHCQSHAHLRIHQIPVGGPVFVAKGSLFECGLCSVDPYIEQSACGLNHIALLPTGLQCRFKAIQRVSIHCSKQGTELRRGVAVFLHKTRQLLPTLLVLPHETEGRHIACSTRLRTHPIEHRLHLVQPDGKVLMIELLHSREHAVEAIATGLLQPLLPLRANGLCIGRLVQKLRSHLLQAGQPLRALPAELTHCILQGVTRCERCAKTEWHAGARSKTTWYRTAKWRSTERRGAAECRCTERRGGETRKRITGRGGRTGHTGPLRVLFLPLLPGITGLIHPLRRIEIAKRVGIGHG